VKADNNFFDEQEEASRIKSDIVAKYFSAWANVMKSVIRRRNGDVRIA